MSILPRLLYFFISLPITVPTTQFNEWDKQISRYIWDGKRPRIRYRTLTIRKENGGMSLPNLRYYYYSAQLRTTTCWCDNNYEAKWKEMERECSGIPIQAVMGDHKLMTVYQVHIHPLVSFTLQIWFEISKQIWRVR